MDGRKKYWLSMALAGLVLLAVFLPGRLKQIQCDRFAKPLYSHALPEGSRLVQKSCVKGEAGDSPVPSGRHPSAPRTPVGPIPMRWYGS